MSQMAADNCHLFAQDIRKLRVKSIEHVSCHSRDAVRTVMILSTIKTFHNAIHSLA